MPKKRKNEATPDSISTCSGKHSKYEHRQSGVGHGLDSRRRRHLTSLSCPARPNLLLPRLRRASRLDVLVPRLARVVDGLGEWTHMSAISTAARPQPHMFT